MFIHTGPRIEEAFSTSNFLKQIAEIEKGRRDPIMYIGNLNTQRDFLDIRDILRSYWLTVNRCKYGKV